MIEKREFGFISFDNVMVRHKAFADKNELQNFLREFVPSDAYYSCAYYDNPKAEMDKKDWLGADLIFDIDADHIPTQCDKVHDEWTCGACGFSGKGIAPEKCPVCGKEKFEVNTWLCEVCLQSAREETIKLLNMLLNDFGFSAKEVHVFFSGHRGYHVHVENETVQTLDTVARKEIVDYFSGLGINFSFHGLDEKYKETSSAFPAQLDDFGWRKRLALGLQRFIQKATEDDLKRIGLKSNVSNAILRNKALVLKDWSDMKALSRIKGVGVESWRKIIEHVVKLESAKIDTVVTTDVHRLIRLAGTLHGKTGLKKIEFPASAIDSFDPFKDAVAFKTGTVKVYVSDAPSLRIGDETFGPYKNQEVELPTGVAVLLVCKNRAEVVG
ncbi:MAG: DNA primase small subunit PriS [Candidatus Bathyarchaeota archaeon]|jgi:DNA primase small subunit|nr:DNA primase small subunit PriS [Candidatus Bathyarchaeota archaeon A05DMB-5]MDH7557306.1 DNA primase small subunit PriS [Candidatus Bathyarchaeota archaeon]